MRAPAAGRPTDFFSLNLRARRRLRRSKLLAIRRIVANPRAYGLRAPDPIPNQPFFETVDPTQVHIGQAATAAVYAATTCSP